jgi:hypothetical protein
VGAVCNEPHRVPCVCLCERESGICTIAASTITIVYVISHRDELKKSASVAVSKIADNCRYVADSVTGLFAKTKGDATLTSGTGSVGSGTGSAGSGPDEDGEGGDGEPQKRLSRDMNSRAEKIAEGNRIRKVDDLVNKFGGKRADWTKKKTWNDFGREIHYYEGRGIGVKLIKWAGQLDPFF